MRLRLSAQIVLLSLCFVSNSWAQVKWIPEQDRVRAKMSGDFKTADGQRTSLKDPKSKVVFLNFWATWCLQCREEMPWMADLARKFSTQGLQVMAATNEDPKVVRRFLQGKDFPYPIVLDAGDSLLDRFKVKSLPTTIVIDAEGRVALRVNEVYRWNSPETITAFEDLLSESKQP